MNKKALIPAVPLLAALAFAASPALADAPEAVSANWAGYEITPNSPDSNGFTNVSGSWVQPSATCTDGTATYSAFWVGIGGGSQQSQALEQTGTQADCSASGSVSYFAWYELVPNGPVQLSMQVHPGDRMSAEVRVNGSSVVIYLIDHTTGAWTQKNLQMSDPDTSTAEWVAEAPSSCQGGASGNCTPLPLANFGKVTFTNASASADGLSGGIENADWTAEPLALDPSQGNDDLGYGDAFGYVGDPTSSNSSTAGASPSSVSSSGNSFSVSYSADAANSGSSTSTGSDGGGSGYGSSSGYGDGGYGGSGSGYGYGYGDGGYGGSGYGYGGSGYGGSGDGYGYGDGGSGYGDSGSGYGYTDPSDGGAGFSITVPGFGVLSF